MYHIKVETGETIFLPSVYYNKISPTSGCFIKATKEDAQGIVVNGTVYSINEKYPIGDAIKATLTYVTDWTEEITAEYEAKLCKEAQDRKIAEIAVACNEVINNGSIIELSDGSAESFAYSLEDQANISEMFNAVIMGATQYPYHADGEECRMYSAQDILTIYVMLSTLKTSQLTYHNQLRAYVQSLTKAEDVEGIKYGQELTGSYLEAYNNIMTQAKVELNKVIAKVTQAVQNA